MNRKILFASALLWISAIAAQAWDDGGHLLIGEIAARKLRPEVVQKIEALLPLLDTQFNDNQPYNLVTVGNWLDDMRGLGKANPWSRLHYIDAPCTGDTFTEPPPPHALSALDQATVLLRAKDTEPKARAEALAQVIHIVGDIHQPLHTASRNDAGGNAVLLTPLFSDGSGPANLHAFWDGAYRYDSLNGNMVELWPRSNHASRPPGVNSPGPVAEEAASLLASKPQLSPTPLSKQPWHEWAYETHMIACESGWPKEWTPENKNAPLQLTPAFVHRAHELARQQILKAGERLAALLNQELGDEPPKK